MKALLCGAMCAFGLLGAVGAQAHDHDGWRDRGWHDRGWHRGWEARDYRPYGYRPYGYAPRYCPPALPRYRVWHEGYYREAYPRYRSYDYYPRSRGDAEVVLSFPLF